VCDRTQSIAPLCTDAAGVAKHDERGRTVCIHSLRDTHGTLLSKAGVAPRVVQSAMRHASLGMTGIYVDPIQLDVAGALRALPALPLEAGSPMPLQSMGDVEHPVAF
jgi:integrase